MRSAEEVRAEIDQLKRDREMYVSVRVNPAWERIRIAALEWVLADEQDKPKETGK